MPTKQQRPKVPKFRTEAEEAKWWDDHQEMVEDNLIQAIEDGTARRGTAQRLVEEAHARAHAISIRMPENDLALARKLAESKGLPYQTYIKSLLHEALKREARKL